MNSPWTPKPWKNEGFKPPIYAFFSLKNEGCRFRWKNVPPKKTDHFSGYVKGVGVWLTVWCRKDVDIWPPKMVVWLFASNNLSFSKSDFWVTRRSLFLGVGVYIGLHMDVGCIKLKQKSTHWIHGTGTRTIKSPKCNIPIPWMLWDR